jgi:TPR repeat protein
MVQEIMKRVEANDAIAMGMLGSYYNHGQLGLQQDHVKAMELYVRAADLGNKKAHHNLGSVYHEDLKKAKFHFEAAAMAGHEEARFNIGGIEFKSGNKERAIKHWAIAASAGHYTAIYALRLSFEGGAVSRESIDTTLAAYNSSCVEMRSEARDTYIRIMTETD